MKRKVSLLLVIALLSTIFLTSHSVNASLVKKYLPASDVKLGSTQSKLIKSTINGDYETDGFTKTINLNGNIKSEQAFYIKINESVFNLNPTKIVYKLKCDDVYSSRSGKFYFSNENNGATPENSENIVVFGDGVGFTIDSFSTEFEVDLTDVNYKSIVDNKLNYFYLFNKTDNTNLNQFTQLTLESVCVYYEGVANEHSVCIDGNQVASVDDGSSYVLPQSDKQGFVAYEYNGKYYNENDIISNISSNVAIKSCYIGNVSMKSGASIRLGSFCGLRFYTTVNQEKIEELIAKGATVDKGTIIAPIDKINSLDFTTDIGQENIDYVDVKYIQNSGFYSDNTITGSIVNIKDQNLIRNFVGRGYVKVKLGNIEKITYADYFDNDISSNSRNISYIANAYKNTYYEQYLLQSDKIKMLIDKWASLAE